MCEKVALSLSKNYKQVKKGVDTVMGGQVLDYEAKQIARETTHQVSVEAVINMFMANVSEEIIRKNYPSYFEEGKEKYLALSK